MFYIRFKDINILNDIFNVIDVKSTDRPTEVLNTIKNTDMVSIHKELYELSHIEYLPATKNGDVDCVDVYLDYYNK